MSTTAADGIADVVIPDTELVRGITAFIRDTEDTAKACARRVRPSVRYNSEPRPSPRRLRAHGPQWREGLTLTRRRLVWN
jgi:hypothetical protein